jgi:UDP-N-acetylglucosamine 1-carboxyvinyltransferase
MMDKLIVEGGRPLSGTIAASGSKNAALPLMAAALLTSDETILENVPDLQDISTMAMVVRMLGAEAELKNGVMRIDARKAEETEAPYDLVRKMRASFYVLGPLLARHGKAKVSLPGGCALGARPVDLHLKALQRLGCEIELDAGYVIARTDGMKGSRITFDISSVGATGNTLMAAVAAEGTTIIENAACEPEIVDLAEMLIAMGANITGVGTPTITIEGPTPLRAVRWKVIPDRIETGTFLIAGAATAGDMTVTGCRADHLSILLEKLHDAGASVTVNGGSIHVHAPSRMKAIDITTRVYPGFPTDLQAPWTSLMCTAVGDAKITDTIYPERFNHVPELIRLGGHMRVASNSAYVRGVESLKGASVMCSDIRAGAGLVVAALIARGETELLRVYHLDRGYEKLEQKITALGGKIRRLRE